MERRSHSTLDLNTVLGFFQGPHSEVNSGKTFGLRAKVPNGEQGGIFPDFTLNTSQISTTVEKVKKKNMFTQTLML